MHNTSADYRELCIEEELTMMGKETGQYRLVEYWGLLGGMINEVVMMRQTSYQDCFKKLLIDCKFGLLGLTQWGAEWIRQ